MAVLMEKTTPKSSAHSSLPLRIPVVFLCAMRRVACARCGVKVESVPWATGKHRVTDACAWFLAGWAKRLSWQEVATGFHSSWDTVYRSVRMAVEWGLAHRDLGGIEAIGIDELARRRGHRYLTLVYQLDRHCKRLLWIGRERKAETLHGFFDELGAARSAALRFVCSDLWKPYLKVVAERAGQAVHARPLPHHEPLLQGHRRGARGGDPQARRRGQGAGAQASREPDRCAVRAAGRAGAAQSAHGARLAAQGGLPGAVGVCLAVLGGALPPVIPAEAGTGGAPARCVRGSTR